MKYFEITYLTKGQRQKKIVTALHKVEAIQDFKERAIGVYISINEVNATITLQNGQGTTGETNASLTINLSFGDTKVANELKTKYSVTGSTKTITYDLN